MEIVKHIGIAILWTILYLVFEYIRTPFHEYIHFYFANKYYPCKAITYSQFKVGKTNKIEWRKQRYLGSPKGLTIVDNDFLVYTEKQISVIAIMPTVLTIIAYVILFGGITLYLNIAFGIWYYWLLFGGMAISYFSSILKFKIWSDLKIFFKPAEFKEYMKKQHEKTAQDSFNYIKIKGLN